MMQKHSIKYWKIESKYTSKLSSAMIMSASSQRFKDGSTYKFCMYVQIACNPPYKQTGKIKTTMIISLDVEKSSDKIQHPFMIKVLERAGIQETYINTIKAIYSKPTGNIKLNREKLTVIPLKAGRRQGCLLSLYLCSTVPEVLARTIRQQKNIKGIEREKRSQTLNIC